MIRKLQILGGSLFLAFLFAGTALGQVNVRGQILLPDGDLPRENVRFFLTSDDGRINEIRFTDSNGRFILERLSGMVSYTIVVESDGTIYDKTTYSFMPSYEVAPRITLRPLAHAVVTSKPTVSAASGYKPDPKTAELHNAALKEI